MLTLLLASSTPQNMHTHVHTGLLPRLHLHQNMQSLQDMASLAKVSTEHLIEEVQRRLHCAGKQEKKTIFIGTPAAEREGIGGREGRREEKKGRGRTCMQYSARA